MNLRHETVVTPAAPFPRKEACPAEKGSRHVGLVFISFGALLLSLAAEGALADTELGGGGRATCCAAPRGADGWSASAGRTRSGLSRPATTGSPAVRVRMSSTAGWVTTYRLEAWGTTSSRPKTASETTWDVVPARTWPAWISSTASGATATPFIRVEYTESYAEELRRSSPECYKGWSIRQLSKRFGVLERTLSEI